MNEHILLVMKYLNDNESVTQEELSDSCKTACTAYIDATAAHHGTAAYVAAAVATATYAAYIYATTATPDDHYAKNAIDRYFNFAGENKQDYINEINN